MVPQGLRIGDLLFAFEPELPDKLFQCNEAYKSFASGGEPDVTLRVHCGELPDISSWAPVFDSGGVWALWKDGGRLAIGLRSPQIQLPAYQIALYTPEIDRVDIYTCESPFQDGYCCIESVLFELLMVQRLALGGGVLFHACAIIDGVRQEGERQGGERQAGERGRLFLGNSGAGKSTTARLWKGRAGVSLLSDDRVIVRQRQGRFWMYGTPWHGDARAASPLAAPLDQVFILRQADCNQAVSLKYTEAMAALLVRAFPTFWNAEGMAFTLAFLDAMAQSLPCYELGFLPEPGVVDYVRCL